jgi:hypothetical protein
MHRTFATLTALFAFVSLAAGAFAAEPDRPPPSRPVWGTVTKATAESITIAPEAPAAARREARRGARPAEPKPAPAAPAERTFALEKDETEFMFAEVGMRRLMADGTTLRTLADPEPATAADLKEGQLVEVTPGDDAADAAERVIIAWSVPGTITKVTNDSITFRPADADAVKEAAGANNHAAAAERTLKIQKDATRVRIATARPPQPSPAGRGSVTAIDYKNGTTADLKPDQNVIVCVKGDAAAKITILVPGEAP